jgi:hypothetical protein
MCAIRLNFFALPFRPNSIHFSPLSHLTCGPNQLRGPKYPCFVPLPNYRPARRQFRSARSTLRASAAAAKEHAVSSAAKLPGGHPPSLRRWRHSLPSQHAETERDQAGCSSLPASCRIWRISPAPPPLCLYTSAIGGLN